MTEKSIISLRNGKLLFGWGEKITIKEPSYKHPAWFETDFFLKKPTWYTHPYYAIVEPDHFLLNAEKKAFEWGELNPFEHFFNASKAAIISKIVDKIVPYTYLEANIHPNAEEMLNHLMLNDQGLYIYGSWDEDSGFMGATPELLFDLKDNLLYVEAVAGTAKVPELLKAKEQMEHEWVVLDLKEKLKTLGQVSIKEQEIKPFHNLYHLLTPIEVQLDKIVSFDTIVSLLHPTPALGAYPPEKGIPMLREWEEMLGRGIYGAPFGYQFEDESRAYVAIRNIQWSEGKAKIYVGCGVTALSQYEQEWEEICLKAKSVRDLLGV